ncbi:MAG: phenylalanine--tRNA ligase subunit alpha [candidate division KSB1 bacterium]|nr:phenylalanine--tRNA ligase subunit alpha [candidate division KSB1 bacterium]
MEITLTEDQWKIFKTLLDAKVPLQVLEIARKTGLDQTMVMGTVTYGQSQGWLKVEELSKEELVPTLDAREQLAEGLPERRILALLAQQTRMPMRAVAEEAKNLGIPMNEIIRWGSLRGWLEKQQGELIITEAGRASLEKQDDDEKALALAIKFNGIYLEELTAEGLDVDRVKKLLTHRPALAKIKSRTIRLVQLTEEGRQVFSKGVQVKKERNVLTSADITSGAWRQIQLRHYDVTLEAEKVYPAKIHPLQKILQQTRRAFLEMGFTEIVSPQVESAFWDFDALFQPQDHPARDMQDTFYLKRPLEARLPDAKTVERVRLTHENGWQTGSTGWRYHWEENRARQVVLRTHTTATTVRALAENPNPPRKVFCVGRVYRNEAISYKHLPEFHQVDGIIIDEQANLATLLGTLAEFYRKMGFEKVRFKPAFFPYTEPSAEVFVWMPSKKKWIELGGSGIFRPEVTLPFGCKVPVLAWGLGLERLAMLRYGIDDIRDLYWSDLDNIREVPLCQ